jgi:protein-L-isoaspartate(D-aspartate) O-methyltransferase
MQDASLTAVSSDEAFGNFLLTLRARGYRDARILTAIERAPREHFLRAAYCGFAYHDLALPLPCGQEATAPFTVIEAVSALQIEPHHTVLEIGTGSGWQTAILAGLARAVVSLERFRTLAEAADERLQRLGYINTVVTHADGEAGLPAAAPFDRIIINAAVDGLSPLLMAQLADDGMAVLPVIDRNGQFLMRFSAEGARLVETGLGAARFAPLIPEMAAFL